MKTINIEISGEDTMINSGIESYAKRYGWTGEEGETALEATERILKNHFKEAINEYRSNEAGIVAKEQSAMVLSDLNLKATDKKDLK